MLLNVTCDKKHTCVRLKRRRRPCAAGTTLVSVARGGLARGAGSSERVAAAAAPAARAPRFAAAFRAGTPRADSSDISRRRRRRPPPRIISHAQRRRRLCERHLCVTLATHRLPSRPSTSLEATYTIRDLPRKVTDKRQLKRAFYIGT